MAIKAVSNVVRESTSAGAFDAGVGGTQQVFVQETRPPTTGTPWVWWQTDSNGNIINLIVNTGT